MAYIIFDRDNDSAIRNHMRRSMRGSYKSNGGSPGAMMRDHEVSYKKGYEEGWEDCEKEMMGGGEFRRDSHGRFI